MNSFYNAKKTFFNLCTNILHIILHVITAINSLSLLISFCIVLLLLLLLYSKKKKKTKRRKNSITFKLCSYDDVIGEDERINVLSFKFDNFITVLFRGVLNFSNSFVKFGFQFKNVDSTITVVHDW